MPTSIQNFDIVGALRQGEQYGLQRQQQMRQAQDQATLRQLAPQIIQGNPQAFDQAAAIDPEAAGQYQSAGDAQLRRMQGAIAYIEQAQKTGNPQAVEAAYQQVKPYLARITGKEPPATFAESEPGFNQAKAQIAMLGSGKQDLSERYRVVGGSLVDLQNPTQAIYTPPPSPRYFQTNEGLVQVGPEGAREITLGGGMDEPVMARAGMTTAAFAGLTPEQNQQAAADIEALRAAGVSDEIIARVAERYSVQGDQALSQAPQGRRLLPASTLASQSITPYQQAQLDLQRDKMAMAEAARGEAKRAREAAQEVKADAKRQEDMSRQAAAVESASALVGAIDALRQSPGYADLGTAWGDAQIATPLVRNDAKDAQAQLDNIGGQVALATMARLKALSSQGATGFGALSAPELKLLQNAIATLQSGQISHKQLDSSLQTIRDTMDKVENWAPQGSGSAGARYQVGQVIEGQNGRRYRVTGGDMNDPDVEEVR